MNIALNDHQMDGAKAFNSINASPSSSVSDLLDVTRHLVKAAIMACDSIEDIESRNGFVALLAEIDDNLLEAADEL